MAKKTTVAKMKKELAEAVVKFLSRSRKAEVERYYRLLQRSTNTLRKFARRIHLAVPDNASKAAIINGKVKADRRLDSLVRKMQQNANSTRNRMAETDRKFDELMATEGRKLNEFVIQYKVLYSYDGKNGNRKRQWITVSKTIRTRREKLSAADLQRVRDAITEEVENSMVYEDAKIEEFAHVKIRQVNTEIGFDDIKNGNEKLRYSFLRQSSRYVKSFTNNNHCVLAMILDQLAGKPGFKYLNMTVIKKQFAGLGVDYMQGISVKELIRWVKEYHARQLSVFCINPCFMVSTQYTPERLEYGTNHCTLTFIVNNNHVYPITDEKMKTFVSKAKRLDIQDIVKFNYRASKYEFVERITQEHLDMCDSGGSGSDLDFGLDVQEEDVASDTEDIQSKVERYKGLVDGTLEGQVFLVNDVYKVFKEVSKKHSSISNMRYRSSKLSAFVHPVTSQVIENGENYYDRKQICERLYQEFPCENFVFKNQSLSKLGQELFLVKCGRQSLMSYYTADTAEIYDKFPTCPLVGTLVEKFDYDSQNCMAFDHTASYPNAVLSMDCDYAQFAICDEWKHMSTYDFRNKDGQSIVVVGDYLIKAYKIGKHGIRMQKQVITHNLMRYLLANKMISRKQVLMYRKASYCIKKEVLADFMKFMMTIIPRDEFEEAKTFHNSFLGHFGTRYETQDTGFVTDSWDTVCAMYNDNKEGFHVTDVDDLFMCGNVKKTRKVRENSSIFRQILCQGQIQLLEMVKSYVGPESTLIGYNTDCVYVQNPLTVEFASKLHHGTEWNPRRYKKFEPRTDSHEVPSMNRWNQLQDIQFDGEKVRIGDKYTTNLQYIAELKEKSFCCVGGAGFQKSTVMTALFDESDTIMVSLSAKVVDNCKKAGIKNANTLDSQFYRLKKLPASVKRVQVDEFGMLDVKWIELLYELHQSGIIIQLFGDMNQIEQIGLRYFDYMNKKIFREMCGNNLMVKGYFEKSSRYDVETKEVLDYLLEHGRLHPKLKDLETDPKLELNIVARNELRHDINKRFADDFKVGMQVMCNENWKGKLIINSKMYLITKVLPKHLVVSDLDTGKVVMNSKGLTMEFPKSRFNLPFAHTVHKYQGTTVDEPYNIHQLPLMTRNALYTAISRTKRISHVHLDYTRRYFRKTCEKLEPTVLEYEKSKVGYIYEMYNEKHNVFYVGMSRRPAEERVVEHLLNSEDTVKEVDGEWVWKTIAKVYYLDDEILRRYEKNFIHLYMEDGKEMLNKQNRVSKGMKYDMVAPVVDERISERFKITECGDCFQIQYRDENGVKKRICNRFGKRKTKEEAKVEIERKRDELTVSFS